MEMVELSLVEEHADRTELQQLIASHLQYTQSPLARRILENWNEYVEQFIKVTPFEYKKILQEQKMEAINRKIAQIEHDY
jgi:glutamate synthase (NADPH/NADH) large chain